MTTRFERAKPWLFKAALALGLGALTLQPYSVCPFAVATGLPCPGCGLTRSFVALAQGQLSVAWHVHPLGPVLASVATSWLLLRVLRRHWRTKLTTYDWSNAPSYVWWAALVLVVAVWVARFYGALGGPVDVHSPLLLFRR